MLEMCFGHMRIRAQASFELWTVQCTIVLVVVLDYNGVLQYNFTAHPRGMGNGDWGVCQSYMGRFMSAVCVMSVIPLTLEKMGDGE